jgi:hypothetical protein
MPTWPPPWNRPVCTDTSSGPVVDVTCDSECDASSDLQSMNAPRERSGDARQMRSTWAVIRLSERKRTQPAIRTRRPPHSLRSQGIGETGVRSCGPGPPGRVPSVAPRNADVTTTARPRICCSWADQSCDQKGGSETSRKARASSRRRREPSVVSRPSEEPVEHTVSGGLPPRLSCPDSRRDGQARCRSQLPRSCLLRASHGERAHQALLGLRLHSVRRASARLAVAMHSAARSAPRRPT